MNLEDWRRAKEVFDAAWELEPRARKSYLAAACRGEESVRAEVRVRYRHVAAPATITPLENDRALIVFDEPQRAITPGQASVFYRGDEVIGGGWIVRSV